MCYACLLLLFGCLLLLLLVCCCVLRRRRNACICWNACICCQLLSNIKTPPAVPATSQTNINDANAQALSRLRRLEELEVLPGDYGALGGDGAALGAGAHAAESPVDYGLTDAHCAPLEALRALTSLLIKVWRFGGIGLWRARSRVDAPAHNTAHKKARRR